MPKETEAQQMIRGARRLVVKTKVAIKQIRRSTADVQEIVRKTMVVIAEKPPVARKRKRKRSRDSN
jgi:hypothetical protein